MKKGVKTAVVVIVPMLPAAILYFGLFFMVSQLWPELLFEVPESLPSKIEVLLVVVGGFIFLFATPYFYGVERLRERILSSGREEAKSGNQMAV